jgi:hypothetical protein
MRFFTRDWLDGALSDSDAERRERDYKDHCTAIWGQLTPELRKLAREIDLHDGVIEQASLRRESGAARLVVVTGDLQRGYWTTVLDYCGMPEPDIELTPLRRAIGAGVAEILASEVDVAQRTRFVHRLVLIDQSEICLSFDDLALSVTARPDRSLRPDMRRWVEE